jgi:hypothetical protein
MSESEQSGRLSQGADGEVWTWLYVMRNLVAVRGYRISVIIHRFAGSSIRKSLNFAGEIPDFQWRKP